MKSTRLEILQKPCAPQLLSVFDELHDRGWVTTHLQPNETLQEFAAKIGTVLPHRFGSANRFLVAMDGLSAKKNTASHVYGRGCFPLHTDLAYASEPPRYLLLRSHFGASGAATCVLDPFVAIGTAWLELIKRGTWRISTGTSTRAGTMRLPGTQLGFRWDPHLMRPLNRFAVVASSEILPALQSSTISYKHTWQRAQQVLLIDNWRVLHGRAEVAQKEWRCMERIYLKELFCV